MLIEQYKIEAGRQLDSHYPTIYFCIMRLRFFPSLFLATTIFCFFHPIGFYEPHYALASVVIH